MTGEAVLDNRDRLVPYIFEVAICLRLIDLLSLNGREDEFSMFGHYVFDKVNYGVDRPDRHRVLTVVTESDAKHA